MAGALIVTAALGKPDFAWLDRQRQAYFPRERNQLPAHLTMFHALPPSLEIEAGNLFKMLVRRPAPPAAITGLINLGGGVAYRITSNELVRLRAEIAENFYGLLTAQDSAGWRPHVTIQNKVSSAEARALIEVLERDYRERPLSVTGLALHRYLGGPWEPLGRWSFRA